MIVVPGDACCIKARDHNTKGKGTQSRRKRYVALCPKSLLRRLISLLA
jgi:hypothetical protein